jgi:trans-aconitate methyltransferase
VAGLPGPGGSSRGTGALNKVAVEGATGELRQRRQHGYESARPDVQRHVPRDATSIVEFGCSSGALGDALKRRQRATIVGVEVNAEYAREATAVLDRVFVGSAEDFVAGPAPREAPFDCLIAADVLEHLVDPWTTLRQASAWLVDGATVVISLPNVLYWRALKRVVLERRWPREDEGIFDRSHLRWFGPRDAEELVAPAGLRLRHIDPQYWESGKALVRMRRLARTPLAPYLPAQLIVVAEKR